MTEADILYELHRYQIPEHMHDSVVQYVLRGVHPGTFLSAVISNDLRAAVCHADEHNERRLVQWAKWFHNEAPANCHGSPEALRKWVQMHAALRAEKMEAR